MKPFYVLVYRGSSTFAILSATQDKKKLKTWENDFEDRTKVFIAKLTDNNGFQMPFHEQQNELKLLGERLNPLLEEMLLHGYDKEMILTMVIGKCNPQLAGKKLANLLKKLQEAA